MADIDFWARALQDDYQREIQEGWGNDQALEDARLAAEVQAMTSEQYARFRREHRIGGPDLVEFLAARTKRRAQSI